MIRLWAAIGIMMTTQTAAQTHCPTRADLETGVQLIDRFGNNSLFIQRADGLYQVKDGTVNWGPHPHPLLRGIRVSAVGDLTIEYASDPAELDVLAPDTQWVSNLTYLQNGAVVAAGTATVYNSGPSLSSPNMLGSCPYDITTYRVTLDMSGDFVAKTNGSEFMSGDLDFAPELGLVVAGTILDRRSAPSGNWGFHDIMIMQE